MPADPESPTARGASRAGEVRDGASRGLRDVLPARFVQRADESDDAEFYAPTRLVTHIDDATIAALTEFYRSVLRPGMRVLDLMSSWVSHLPAEMAFARVAGQGMNPEELARNPRLTARVVQDLNRSPELPWDDRSFDAALCAVSVQYSTRPLELFASVRRVLAPGGLFAVAISHRMFPTKAVAIWHPLDVADRARLVGVYFRLAGGWTEPEIVDRSPAGADPLVVVTARREGS
ncbi:MAG TPA: methyltransferase domain-containing protein [Candidatus Binatia bacterium]|nr:methyltransferase domain-containing protein [Candidatus Binatia bacterium]